MKRDARVLFAAILVAGLLAALTACAPVRTRPGAEPPPSANPYRVIDAHALAAPASVTGSVKDLAAYLTSTTQSDREKARAIFRWVAANIDYDVKGLNTARYGDLSPNGVLRRRTAVCEGYANLFDSLAEAAGLQAVTVSGYAKGMGYRAGDGLAGPPDHAWNAVKLDGRWALIDCTWGAGLFYEGTGYRRKFDPYFFCTSPGDFLFTHFPENPRWQLVDPPITRAEFERRAYLKAPFFENHLKVLEGRRSTVHTDGSPVTLKFSGPPGVALKARLYAGGDVYEGDQVPVVERGGVRTVRILPPGTGTFYLRLYVSSAGAVSGGRRYFDWAAEYRIVCSRKAKAGPPERRSPPRS